MAKTLNKVTVENEIQHTQTCVGLRCHILAVVK